MTNEVIANPIGEPLSGNAAPSARGWRFWMLSVVSAVVLPTLMVVVIEFALRAFGVGYPTDLLVSCTTRGQAASCYNLFFPAPFFPPGMIKSPQIYAIPSVKPSGTFRIFVLGESAAMGDPDPAYGFSRFLEVMLRKRFPSIEFEIVNTGSVAINSHVLLPIARGLASQKPDIFIIYSGNNEVVGPYGPGTALTTSAMSLPVVRASIFLRSTRIGQLLTRAGAQKREWGGMEMFLDKQIRATSPLMSSSYSNFEHNLRDTVEVARKSGARVIVSTVATNLKDCGPFASLHREGLTPDVLKLWEALVQQGAESERTQSYAEALQDYLAAQKIDSEFAELEFRIGRTYLRMGDFARAQQHFLRAREFDTLRFRADSKINDINRSVASSSGAELVDADSIFAKQSLDGLIGSELVYEHVHLTPEGNYLLARAMFLQIASKLPSPTGHVMEDEDVLSQSECEHLLALTPHDRLRMATEMLQRLQRPPFTNQLNHAEQVLRWSMQVETPDENPNQTAAEYQWAIQRKPDDRILHYNFGLFLFNYDRTAAAEQLKMSQPWDGFPVFAPDGTPIE